MARCLVTGHKGYIGSSVYKELEDRGHEVIGIDLKDGDDILDIFGPKFSNSGKTKWHEFQPEYIFHLAAIPRVVYSVENPIEVVENNVLSALYILEFARSIGAKRVIYSSSSSVLGNGLGPENPYGASKYMPESLCGVWSRLYNIDTVCLRYFNVYSPDQRAEGPYATAIANWMQYIRESKNPFITGTGEQSRDMAHKLDVVSANLFCMESETNFNGSWYDVGTGTNISLNNVKNIVHSFFPHVIFDYVKEREGDVMYTKANIEPLQELGWEPRYNISDGISECFSILRDELS
jgi:nucleoside-diphosphate-sugar epimerase